MSMLKVLCRISADKQIFLRSIRRKGTPGPFAGRLNTPEDAAVSVLFC